MTIGGNDSNGPTLRFGVLANDSNGPTLLRDDVSESRTALTQPMGLHPAQA